MHKPLLILLTLPRQPDWLAVWAKSRAKEEEEEEEEEEREEKQKFGEERGEEEEWTDWVLTTETIEKRPRKDPSVPNKRAWWIVPL